MREKYLKLRIEIVRQNWIFCKLPFQIFWIIIFFIEGGVNKFETVENMLSGIGSLGLLIIYHALDLLQKRYVFMARYAGLIFIWIFVIYMTEIVVQNGKYKIYKGYLTMISLEFFLSFSLVVDVWMCPLAIGFSHIYLLFRFFTNLDEVPDSLIACVFCPFVFHSLTWYLVNNNLKRDFMLAQAQRSLIDGFFNLLQSFPERIIITQKNVDEKIEYTFTNDDLTKQIIQAKDDNVIYEDIIRVSKIGVEQENEVDEPNPISIVEFLNQEIRKIDITQKLEIESNIQSFIYESLMRIQNRDNDRMVRYDSRQRVKEDWKHFNVKTKQVNFDDLHILNSRKTTYLHIFNDKTNDEKLKEEKANRDYQRLMLSSVAHEFRNPLNSIKGNIELIDMVWENERIRKFSKSALSSWVMLNSYVDDILDLGEQ